MALSAARHLLGPCRTPVQGSLLLLLLPLGLGWTQPLKATVTPVRPGRQEPVLPVAGMRDPVSLAPGLSSLFCVEVSHWSARRVLELVVTTRQKNITLHVDQLRCLASRLSGHLTLQDLDTLPVDMLPFLNPALFPGPQACAGFLSRVSKANIHMLPPGAPERQRLLPVALACRGVRGFRVSEADVQALGSLACDLPGRFVTKAAASLLPRLASCPGPLGWDQQEAARMALKAGGPPYGPPSRWSVSTLDALQGLLAVLDMSIIHSIPQGVVASWLQRISGPQSWRKSEPTDLLPRFRRDTEKACPPEKKVEVVDESLFWYEEWELEACVDGTMLAEQMDNVNRIPFTYQQLSIFKRKLDKTYPQGYPEALVRKLGLLFRYVLPEDISKWNVTSLDMVKDLFRASSGQSTNVQVTALVARYLLGRDDLDKDTLDFLAGVRPTYLCVLSAEQLESLPLSVLWTVMPKDLDACSPQQLGLLYPKAQLAFQNVSGLEYFGKIKAFLGGASTEDLQALGRQNISMDLATFKQLPVESVVRLTVDDVKMLLGLHVAELKGEENNSPVRDWIFQQHQEDLDQLGLGLQGGVPNGYLILDLSFREAFSRGAPCPTPGPVLAWLSALLLVFTLS
ncbi:mesothelin [Perognathus longimembris pacificus]|uniref:mesothelin n=1 Tax=Perognathus longimembris pacificus TaxID=214514 RepID=UPI002018B053|nr:mesothelin [Perognathus longimembris pacificus]